MQIKVDSLARGQDRQKQIAQSSCNSGSRDKYLAVCCSGALISAVLMYRLPSRYNNAGGHRPPLQKNHCSFFSVTAHRTLRMGGPISSYLEEDHVRIEDALRRAEGRG